VSKSLISISETSDSLTLILSVAVSTTDCQVSRMVAFFHADESPIFSGFKSASIACGLVFLSVTSSPREAYGLLMRLNGDDLHLVNCGCDQRGTIFCRLWYERDQRCVGLQYWSYDGCKPVRYAEDLPNGPRVKRINAIAKVFRCCGPRFTPVQQDWNYERLIKTFIHSLKL